MEKKTSKKIKQPGTDIFRRVLQIEGKAVLAQCRSALPGLRSAMELIKNCPGRVVVIGLGKSGLIGRKISATLASTGTPSLFLHATEALHGDLGMLVSGDVVLVLSSSGETAELRQLLPLLKERRVSLIAFTCNTRSRLAQAAEVLVPIRIEQEACPYNLIPTASTTAMLAVGDALALALMETRGFRKEDFARLHPAGSLGKRLWLRVEAIMRTGRNNPVVKVGTSLKDVLLVMTRTRLGAASVVNRQGRLVGFFTDGDLRRHLADDSRILERKIEEVMSSNPTVIHPEQLASEAAELLRTRGFDNLPVVDWQKHPVGILDERDLLAEGIT